MKILTLFFIFFTISFSLSAKVVSVSGSDLNKDIDTGFINTDKKPVMKKSTSVHLGDTLHYMHFCEMLFEKEYALRVIEIIKKHSPADWNRLRRGIQERKGTSYTCRDSSDSMYMGDYTQDTVDTYMEEFSKKLNINLESKNNTQENSELETNSDTQEKSKSDNNDSFEERLIKLKSLYDKELITKEEYDQERKEILDEM